MYNSGFIYYSCEVSKSNKRFGFWFCNFHLRAINRQANSFINSQFHRNSIPKAFPHFVGEREGGHYLYKGP